MIRRTLALGAVALLLPLLAACGDSEGGANDGGGSGDRSVEEVAEQLQSSGMDAEQADCFAQAYIDADLSEAEIEALQENPGSGLDDGRGADVMQALIGCVGLAGDGGPISSGD